jgi:hypothetical protein
MRQLSLHCATRWCDVRNDGESNLKDAMSQESEANKVDLCEVSARSHPRVLLFVEIASMEDLRRFHPQRHSPAACAAHDGLSHLAK